MRSFFDITNESIFYPLSNRDKRLNFDILVRINDLMKDGVEQLDRDDVVECIKRRIDNCANEVHDDESDEVVIGNSQDLAARKLRYFENCGWLISETDPKTLTLKYQMDDNAIMLLNAFQNIVSNDEKPIEFTGYIYSIYSSLINMSYDQSVEVIEHSKRETEELMSKLRGVNVAIRKMLNKMLQDDEMTPKQIYNQLLREYEKKVVVKVFDNLRGNNSPTKLCPLIVERIDRLFEEGYQKMVEQYLKLKCNDSSEEDKISEANSWVTESLTSIREAFTKLESLVDSLQKKNTTYVRVSVQKAKFLIEDNRNLEGMINNCLKEIANGSDFEDNELFSLFAFNKIDSQSMYTSTANVKKVKAIVKQPNETVDDEEFEAVKKRIFKDTEFNVKYVNKYLMNLLGENETLEIKKVKIQTYEELVKLFLGGLYSQNSVVDYEIEPLEGDASFKGKTISNYLIRRKVTWKQ